MLVNPNNPNITSVESNFLIAIGGKYSKAVPIHPVYSTDDCDISTIPKLSETAGKVEIITREQWEEWKLTGDAPDNASVQKLSAGHMSVGLLEYTLEYKGINYRFYLNIDAYQKLGYGFNELINAIYAISSRVLRSVIEDDAYKYYFNKAENGGNLVDTINYTYLRIYDIMESYINILDNNYLATIDKNYRREYQPKKSDSKCYRDDIRQYNQDKYTNVIKEVNRYPDSIVYLLNNLKQVYELFEITEERLAAEVIQYNKNNGLGNTNDEFTAINTETQGKLRFIHRTFDMIVKDFEHCRQLHHIPQNGFYLSQYLDTIKEVNNIIETSKGVDITAEITNLSDVIAQRFQFNHGYNLYEYYLFLIVLNNLMEDGYEIDKAVGTGGLANNIANLNFIPNIVTLTKEVYLANNEVTTEKIEVRHNRSVSYYNDSNKGKFNLRSKVTRKDETNADGTVARPDVMITKYIDEEYVGNLILDAKYKDLSRPTPEDEGQFADYIEKIRYDNNNVVNNFIAVYVIDTDEVDRINLSKELGNSKEGIALTLKPTQDNFNGEIANLRIKVNNILNTM